MPIRECFNWSTVHTIFGSEPNPKMQKCDLCLERLAENNKPICVGSCPMKALDVGPLNELKAKYGDIQEAESFFYSRRVKPFIFIKPKATKSGLTGLGTNELYGEDT